MNQMMTLKRRLQSLDKDIRVGIVAGEHLPISLLHQLYITPGMKATAICCKQTSTALEYLAHLKSELDVVSTLDDLNFTVQRGRIAITDKPKLVTASRLINVLVECSAHPFESAMNAVSALQHLQHVVTLNTGADLLYGPHLLRVADEQGMVYTYADGTRPAALKKMIDNLDLWGFDLVMAGCVNDAFDRCAQTDAKNQITTRRTLATLDGTTLNIDMAVLANGINARVAVAGMHGLHAPRISDVLKFDKLSALWEDKKPCVEYATTMDAAGGIFVVGHHAGSNSGDILQGIAPAMKSGPFTLFYNPFILNTVEVTATIAEAYLDCSARLQPIFGHKTNVFTYAKKPLRAGDTLGGAGSTEVYGAIESSASASITTPALPILLSDNLRLKRDIEKDQRINFDDVEYNAEEPAFMLYRLAQLYKVVVPEKRKPEEANTAWPSTNVQYA